MPRNKKRRASPAGKPASPTWKKLKRPAAVPEKKALAAPGKEIPAAQEAPRPAGAGKIKKPDMRAAAAAIAGRLPAGASVRSGFRRFGRGVLADAVRQNPVLVRTLAVCTVLAAATSLKNGLLLAAAAAAVTVPLAVAMALLRSTPLERRCPAFIWPAAALVLAGALTVPVCWLSYRAAPNVTMSAGIFLPLTALNATLLVQAIHLPRRGAVLHALTAGCGDSLGFAAVIVLIASLREIFGSGTLYGRPIFGKVQFDFLLAPAGAFLLLGCLMALAQWLRQKRMQKRKAGENR